MGESQGLSLLERLVEVPDSSNIDLSKYFAEVTEHHQGERKVYTFSKEGLNKLAGLETILTAEGERLLIFQIVSFLTA